MGKKLGCTHNPNCGFVEEGRVCARAVLHNGSCKRDPTTMSQEFRDNHGVYRKDDGTLAGDTMQRFKKHHSSWRG